MNFNYVFISPHFPPNWYLFAVRLAEIPGVKVLAVGEASYHELKKELKAALTEYYRVDNMEEYDSVLRAVGYFTHRYGKIDRIESHNEHWIELDARLRTDFNVFGFKTHNIDFIKRKSRMKELFIQANVNVVQGKAVNSKQEALEFASQYGYPLIIKPDIGVGARATHKILASEDFETLPEDDFVGAFAEQFIVGKIETFDGLVDRDGNIIFHTSHGYSQGLMEIAKANTHAYFYTRRVIPQDLIEVGKRTVKAFGLQERFFHIEYFRLDKDNSLVGLEINVRPPGGFTMDQFNFAHNADLYKKYAELVVYNDTAFEYERPYHIMFVSRKNHIPYGVSNEDILTDPTFASRIVFHGEMPQALSLMGNFFFMLRTPDFEEAQRFVQLVWRTPKEHHELIEAQAEQKRREETLLRQKELEQQQQLLLQQAKIGSSPHRSRSTSGNSDSTNTRSQTSTESSPTPSASSTKSVTPITPTVSSITTPKQEQASATIAPAAASTTKSSEKGVPSV